MTSCAADSGKAKLQRAALAAGGAAALAGVIVVVALLVSPRAGSPSTCVFTRDSPADSCRTAYDACGATNRTIWVRSSVRGEVAFSAFCLDGFALAMQIDGTRNTFVYGAPLWSSTTLLNPDASAVQSVAEAKLQPFVSTSGTTIRLIMTVSASGALTGAPVDLDIPGNFTSLASLFGAGAYVATAASLGFASCGWRGLTPGGLLPAALQQAGC